MRYVNLSVETLTSESFLGSEPVDRATWVCLLRYCAQHETGGIIKSAADWGDRKWMQLCGITKEEAHRESSLWYWNGTDLVVNHYPVEQEEAAKARREAGKRYGAGHPKGELKVTSCSPESSARDKDKDKDKDNTDSSEPQSTSEPESPPFIEIPLIKKDGIYTVTEKQVEEWQQDYPAVDVRQALVSIKNWNIANPNRRKTRKGVLKHITGWLDREQDKGGNKQPQQKQPQEQALDREFLK